MSPRFWETAGAVCGAAGVALGAFAAHGLERHLAERLGYTADEVARRVKIFDTAVRYQLWHALALVMTGLFGRLAKSGVNAAGWSFLLGTIIFSGLLYALCVAGPTWRWLGAIVPIGGVLLIVGWVALAI